MLDKDKNFKSSSALFVFSVVVSTVCFGVVFLLNQALINLI